MIKGMHALIYTNEPEEARAFLRDKLGFPASDAGGGWLIFDMPEADMGCHPEQEGGAPRGTHDISFYCDDIEATMSELQTKGVQFTGPPQDVGFGISTEFHFPGGGTIRLYQPKYDKK